MIPTSFSMSRSRSITRLAQNIFPVAISGNASTIVTLLPWLANHRAASQLTSPPSMMTTLSLALFLPKSKSMQVAIIGFSIPGTQGIIGLDPVATITLSGFSFLTSYGQPVATPERPCAHGAGPLLGRILLNLGHQQRWRLPRTL